MFKWYKKLVERLESLEEKIGLVWKESWEGHERSSGEYDESVWKRLTRLEDKVFPIPDDKKSRFEK